MKEFLESLYILAVIASIVFVVLSGWILLDTFPKVNPFKHLINRASRRKALEFGYRAGIVAICMVFVMSMVMPMVGCSISQVQADVTKVLLLLPDVSGIAQSILTIAATADPAVANYVGVVKSSFAIVQSILTTYQSNMSAIPATVLAQLDSAISAINTNIGSIEAMFPGLSPAVSAGINVGLLSFQAILGYLAAIIPSPVAASAFPKAYAALSSRGVKFGVIGAPIPSQRELEKHFNDGVSKVGFGKAKIHEHWLHLGPVPVLP